MQFKVEELKQMIREELENLGERPHTQKSLELEEGHGGEGSMAVGQLNRLADMVEEVRGMISEQDDLEEWVESKITKAHDYVNTVLNYLAGSVDKMNSQQYNKE
jgi:hypothetical protein